MRVDAALAVLPLSSPKPSLVGRHRDLRAQLNHSVVTLHDLDLGTRMIKVVAPPKIGRQHNFTPPSNTDERFLAHRPIL